MKVKCEWSNKWKDGVLHPVASVFSESASTELVNCLSGVLMDDGGCGIDTLIEKHLELLEGIKRIKQDNTATFSWLIETWGVYITSKEVEMYFAFNENYLATMSLDTFEKVIKAWLGVIQGEPNINNRVEVEV